MVAPMPGKVVRVLVSRATWSSARQPRGGHRSDEDGERAARRPRRHGRRRARAGRTCRWKRAPCSSSSSELSEALAFREHRRFATSAWRRMLVVAILAAAIVASADGRSRPGRARAGGSARARSSSSGRCRSAAPDSPPHRPRRRRGPGDRRPASGRPAVLHGEAHCRSSLDWCHRDARQPEFIITSVEMTDWQMLVEKWERRRTTSRGSRATTQAAGPEAVHDHAAVSAGVARPVHLRGSRGAVEHRLPESRLRHQEPAELSRQGGRSTAAP